MANDITLVFVHGWSVTNIDTYGQLPIRLREEGKLNGLNIIVRNIYLGQYISFHDEVRLQDISRAFQSAVTDTLGDLVNNGGRFIAVTHSTGGPVLRDWSVRYKDKWAKLPMSHLIMLAPANFGSALAQLGKARIGRLKSWFQGVEPGQGVLDWLELGSNDSWKLNNDWIKTGDSFIGPDNYFPFVLIGQAIDRKFYDHLNSYTGELGSDGVVRSAAANLNATFVSVHQPFPGTNNDVPDFSSATAPRTAFRVVRNSSHSDDEMGIMRSEKATPGDPQGADTVNAIIKCIKVATKEDYVRLCDDFEADTKKIQDEEKVEKVEGGFFSKDRYFIHDRYSMVIFRVCDSEGYPVTDYDLVFTAGEEDDANHLPEGFFLDRQQNSRNRETVTYYVDYDIMNKSAAVKDGSKVIRPATNGISSLGIEVTPRPDEGFVHYMSFKLKANPDFFNKVVKPNATTLIEICIPRIVDKNVFLLRGPANSLPIADSDFKKIKPSGKQV